MKIDNTLSLLTTKPFLLVIPLLLAVIIGCAPANSSSSDERLQVVNLLSVTKSSDDSFVEGVRIASTGSLESPTLMITGLTNADSGTVPSWNITIANTPSITTEVKSIPVEADNIIESVDITNTIDVTFGASRTVTYTLITRINGPKISTWLPNMIETYLSASFGREAGTVTLDATTKILSVTDFTNTGDGTGSITTSPEFPRGFTTDPESIELSDPDGPGIAASSISLVGTKLTVLERNDPANTETYTLSDINLAALTEFSPANHVTITDNIPLEGEDPNITANLSFEITPALESGNPTLTITGLTNAVGRTKMYTLTIAPVPGIFGTPGDNNITISITEPSGSITEPSEFLSGVGTLSADNFVLLLQGSVESTYNLVIQFNAALIEDWFTPQTFSTYLTIATFSGQRAQVTLSDEDDPVITLSGDIINVPDGEVALTVNDIPMEYEITGLDALADPDGPVFLSRVTGGSAGFIELTEKARPEENQKRYDVQLNLREYVSSVTVEDISVTYATALLTRAELLDRLELTGTNILIKGYTNTAGTAETGTITFAPGTMVSPSSFTFTNPSGEAAEEVIVGTPIITYLGVAIQHTLSVKFSPTFAALNARLRFQHQHINGGTAVTVENDGMITIADAARCSILTGLVVEVTSGGSVSEDYTVDTPFNYYDRSQLTGVSFTEANISAPVTFEIKDSSGKIADYPVIMNYPQCRIVDLTGEDAGSSGGDGSSGNPYIISKAEHLELAAHLINNSNVMYSNSNFKVISDINLDTPNAPWSSGAGFTPIGSTPGNEDFSSTSHTNRFKGTFDCNSNVISNLYINNVLPFQGLFGIVENGTITNCFLEDVDITGGSHLGGLVGANLGTGAELGKITTSYVTGTVTSSNGRNIGGLVGHNSKGVISSSYASVTVTGVSNVGGLVGYNESDNLIATRQATINNSYATGSVSSKKHEFLAAATGGLVGSNSGASIISNSYATGDVDFTGNVAFGGGLVGYNNTIAGSVTETTNGKLINSYATGTVTAKTTGGVAGGLVGGDVGTTENSYWNSDANSRGVSGTGRSIVAFTSGTRFTTSWEEAIWNFTAEMYPRLINVVCADRQYDPTATDCTSTLAP